MGLASSLEYSWNVTSGLHSLLVKRGFRLNFPRFLRERGEENQLAAMLIIRIWRSIVLSKEISPI